MKDDKEKSTKDDNSSAAALQRGKEAIAAEDKINKKDPQDPKVKGEKEKDAENWRNEG